MARRRKWPVSTVDNHTLFSVFCPLDDTVKLHVIFTCKKQANFNTQRINSGYSIACQINLSTSSWNRLCLFFWRIFLFSFNDMLNFNLRPSSSLEWCLPFALASRRMKHRRGNCVFASQRLCGGSLIFTWEKSRRQPSKVHSGEGRRTPTRALDSSAECVRQECVRFILERQAVCISQAHTHTRDVWPGRPRSIAGRGHYWPITQSCSAMQLSRRI